MSNSNLPFGEALRELMLAKGLTYRELGPLVDLDYSYVNRLVNGAREVPHDEVIGRIAVAFGVPPQHFLEWRIRQICTWLIAHPARVDELFAESRVL